MLSNNFFEQKNINVKNEIVFATDDDTESIFELQQKNLKQHVPETDRAIKGFTTLDLPKETITDIAREGSILIAKEGQKTIGYLITMTKERAGQTEFFTPLLEKIDTLNFEGQLLKERNFCILAQICVDSNFRGTGVLERIYQDAQQTLKDKFELGIGEIDETNQRSLHAHINKIGMKDVGQYETDGVKWHIVVLNFSDEP